MSPDLQSNGNFLSNIRSPAPSRNSYDIVLAPKPEKVGKRMALLNGGPRLYTNKISKILARAENDKDKYGHIVCIIEDISKSDIEVLKSAWSWLNNDFFETHDLNPEYETEALWRPRLYNHRPATSHERESTSIESRSPKAYDHVDGNFVYHGIRVDDRIVRPASKYDKRHVFLKPWEEEKIMCSNTRISYYRVYKYLYLFLVDAPHTLQTRYVANDPRTKRPSLRLPYATNFEGLSLPQVLEYNEPDRDPKKLGRTHYRLFESVDRVFRHRWRRHLLFSLEHKVEPKEEPKPQKEPGSHEEPVPQGEPNPQEESKLFPVAPLCYMLSDALSQTNLNYLTRKVTGINGKLRVEDPTIEERLLEYWEDIVAFLVRGLDETKGNIPARICKFWNGQAMKPSTEMRSDGPTFDPVQRYKTMLEKADQLQRLLVDTFQVRMSSRSVQAARMSIILSMRATQLTGIALLFLPVSVVTGIFGMNFRELNGAVLPIWVFFVVVSPLSIAIVFGLRMYLTYDSKDGVKPAIPYIQYEHRGSGELELTKYLRYNS